MALSNSVDNVLRLVKERTGLPVHVEPDPTLPPHLLSKVTMARGAMPIHRVAYQPNASEAPDYLIIYECGFILRAYTLPPEARCDLASTEAAQTTVRRWVLDNPKRPALPPDKAAGLTSILFNGILTQLRSIPVGLRVDSWIRSKFPDLAGLQEKAMTRQLNDCAAALRPDVQASMPDGALAVNIAMSTAFALYWAETLARPQIALPFQATGHLESGRALLDIWRRIPEDPAKDRELTDAWAARLGISDWYFWAKQSSD